MVVGVATPSFLRGPPSQQPPEAPDLGRFEGRLLAADESPQVVEGDWPHQKIVLIEFKDTEEALRWASSPEYRKIAVDREGSTVATILTVSGLRPWTPR
jgi:uncharacterized protein (DUF1330 family)